MPDIREFKFPETKHGEPGKMVDFDEAVIDIGCSKMDLTKRKMPEMIAWARKQP
jgi:hypothetical protein